MLRNKVWRILVASTVLIIGAASQSSAASAPEPKVSPAIPWILNEFERHPLVGLGDQHGLAQELDFYSALVSDPRFASEVGNVVMEFGESSQPILDRYLVGETVSYTELRKVWTENVGWTPSGTYMGFLNLFAQIRAVNTTLPPDKRIHVWLADPKVDWSQVQSKEQWRALVRTRDTNAVQVIEDKVMSRGKKALVIFGSGHFIRDDGQPMKQLRELIDDRHPGALEVVLPYTGFLEKSCSDQLERSFQGWPIPAIATPVRGSSLETALLPQGCHVIDFGPGGSLSEDDIKLQKIITENFAGIGGHALLYLGPANTLMISPKSPDIYMDETFRAEMSRRMQIIEGHPLTSATAKNNAVSPHAFRH